jgi:hypothetical protein
VLLVGDVAAPAEEMRLDILRPKATIPFHVREYQTFAAAACPRSTTPFGFWTRRHPLLKDARAVVGVVGWFLAV